MTYFQNMYLPTMPQDDLGDLFKALMDARSKESTHQDHFYNDLKLSQVVYGMWQNSF